MFCTCFAVKFIKCMMDFSNSGKYICYDLLFNSYTRKGMFLEFKYIIYPIWYFI